MRSVSPQLRQLQLVLKTTALICGTILIIAASHNDGSTLDLAVFLNFIKSQVQSTSQLQWLFGITFLSAGIFYAPVKVNKHKTFTGEKDLSNDSYILYLLERYQIEKNVVLDQHTACNKIFSCVQDALAYVHLMECELKIPSELGNPLSENEPIHPSQAIPSNPSGSIEAKQDEIKNPFQNTHLAPESTADQPWDEIRRKKVIVTFGVILFTVVLGGLYYANSNSVRYVSKSAVAISSVAPLPETPNSDQVATASIPAQEANMPADKEGLKPKFSTPINDRWIGSWVAEGAKLKLTVTPSLLRLNDEEFAWAGTRPKGIVQCCLAFYEGATTKSDLLVRIAGAQEHEVVPKPETQKTLALVNGLSDGNFKRIVFADPFLKKYFFIYDQNHVYRISRDLGDKADVVIEQFKKQE